MTEIKTFRLQFRTQGFTDIRDITSDIQHLLSQSGLQEGQVLVFVPGSTGGLTTIEFEPGLVKDLKRFFENWIPMEGDYQHNATWGDGNGYAHLRAAMLKPDLLIPFQEGKLLLGTWQQIVFVDFDNRPRHRTIIVQVQGKAR